MTATEYRVRDQEGHGPRHRAASAGWRSRRFRRSGSRRRRAAVRDRTPDPASRGPGTRRCRGCPDHGMAGHPRPARPGPVRSLAARDPRPIVPGHHPERARPHGHRDRARRSREQGGERQGVRAPDAGRPRRPRPCVLCRRDGPRPVGRVEPPCRDDSRPPRSRAGDASRRARRRRHGRIRGRTLHGGFGPGWPTKQNRRI